MIRYLFFFDTEMGPFYVVADCIMNASRALPDRYHSCIKSMIILAHESNCNVPAAFPSPKIIILDTQPQAFLGGTTLL